MPKKKKEQPTVSWWTPQDHAEGMPDDYLWKCCNEYGAARLIEAIGRWLRKGKLWKTQ
jgi:hypothetical protein